jgi:UDP:flavonoid glycosyltransferase YjiC (YdhE family)
MAKLQRVATHPTRRGLYVGDDNGIPIRELTPTEEYNVVQTYNAIVDALEQHGGRVVVQLVGGDVFRVEKAQ